MKIAMVILVPVLSAIAWLALEVMTIINPSNTIPFGEVGAIKIFILIMSAVFAFVLPLITSRRTSRRSFFIWFFASLCLLLLSSGLSGRFLHRDFDAYGMQILLLYFILMIFKLDSLGIVKRKQAVYGILTVSAIILFILLIAWLMMMAYAIVTRVEPRWIESSAYNIVNGLIGFLMIASAGYLWERSKKRLQLKGNDLKIDERDISSMLSPQECELITAFLQAEDMTLTCREMNQHLRSDDSDIPSCLQCLDEHWNATSCPSYRNYKNRINDIKKYIELLQIGTIVPVSENTRDIKKFGWRLRLFDDIRYHHTSRERHHLKG